MDGRRRGLGGRAGRGLGGRRALAWPLDQLGFTLIETLVVLAIVSFAAGITLPRAIEQARDKRAMADLRTLTVALNIYYQTHGTYPLYLQELTDDHLIMSDFAYRNGNGRYYFYAVHYDVAGGTAGGAGGAGAGSAG
ncbi:MAG: type II secretion system protein, partial [Bacillota bacterium]